MIIDKRGDPWVVSAGNDVTDKMGGEAEGVEDFVKEGAIDSIERIGHVKLYQHSFFFSLIA